MTMTTNIFAPILSNLRNSPYALLSNSTKKRRNIFINFKRRKPKIEAIPNQFPINNNYKLASLKNLPIVRLFLLYKISKMNLKCKVRTS